MNMNSKQLQISLALKSQNLWGRLEVESELFCCKVESSHFGFKSLTLSRLKVVLRWSDVGLAD